LFIDRDFIVQRESRSLGKTVELERDISEREGEIEEKESRKHVRAMWEAAIEHREKCNQFLKEHNCLLRISALLFGYVTSEIVGSVQRRLDGFLARACAYP